MWERWRAPGVNLVAACLTIAVALGYAAGSVLAQDDGLDRIDLPDGWRPEGVTTMDGRLYVGSLAGGAIWAADPFTGEGSVLVEPRRGVVAVGVEAEPANGRLWAAGGRTGEVRAYDAASGELLRTYTVDAGFLNDLVATPEAIYVTDSFMPHLVVIPLRPDGGLRGTGRVTTLPLSGDLVFGDGDYNANGIVATDDGLILVQSQPGALFHVDPESGETRAIDVGDAELLWGDGLELGGTRLYVARNRFDVVSVVELDPETGNARLVEQLTSDALDVPSTAALIDGDLWAVNARFGTDAPAEAAYWLTQLDVGAGGDTAPDETQPVETEPSAAG